MSEFLYVDDAARAIVLATERYAGREPVNLGSGEEISIRELVDRIVIETGYEGRVLWDVTKPDGQPRRRLSVERVQHEFGFDATIPFVEGSRRTIQWYLAEGIRQADRAA